MVDLLHTSRQSIWNQLFTRKVLNPDELTGGGALFVGQQRPVLTRGITEVSKSKKSIDSCLAADSIQQLYPHSPLE